MRIQILKCWTIAFFELRLIFDKNYPKKLSWAALRLDQTSINYQKQYKYTSSYDENVTKNITSLFITSNLWI